MFTPDRTYEVVVYRLHADTGAGYPPLAEAADAFLRTQPGFVSRQILQDKEDLAVFLDVVTWETRAAAEAAQQAVQHAPAMQPFLTAIERVLSFGHYHLYAGGEPDALNARTVQIEAV